MASGKADKTSKTSFKNPNKRLPLGPNRAKKNKTKKKVNKTKKNQNNNESNGVQRASASQQLSFFLNQFQSANGVQLSSLELESIKDNCILELSKGLDQDANTLGKHMKAAFRPSWKEVLCEGQLMEGKIDCGSPAIIIFSASAIRSLELLRGLRPLTMECHAVKLFSKHMKVEDQVSLLKNRVNIASGTPSRIKKLIDMEALGISRLDVIVLDMQTDVKGYSLFTLPQVRDEFWDLYKSFFHQRVVRGDLRICLYGAVPVDAEIKKIEKRCS
ncbi:hypothetical protein L1049_017346 [Liquidambar formosana]|uniref:Protein CMSS1 n=1 Tax=Liquidambar formosana TaxID=63359 RepID=A0AAP0X855_LIQFO